MANGLLGKSMASAGNNVTVYTVPSGVEFATVSILLTNLSANDANINIAIGTNVAPAPADYIEYGGVLPANGGILERTCIVCSPGENIIVHADNSNVAIRVFGLEKLN